MNNKVFILIFGLFIIYFLYKKNIIKGGEYKGIKPGTIDGRYELASGPIETTDYAQVLIGNDWAGPNKRGAGYIWKNPAGQKWFIDKGLMPKTGYPKGMPIVPIKIIRNDSNQIIGIINSDGRKFNRFGDLLKPSVNDLPTDKLISNVNKKKVEVNINNKMNKFNNYSMVELEEALKIKKKQNELNNMPQVHSTLSNYELYLKLGTNKVAYSVIKNGTYWADKAYQLKASQADYDNVMGKNIDEREGEFYSIQKIHSIKDNIQEQNEVQEMATMDNNKMNNEETMDKKTTMNKDNTVLCPGKPNGEYCDGIGDCWRTNFCECPKAQNLCKKNMANKIMKDFNINENEEVDRILGIFHGNKTLLHNLPKNDTINKTEFKKAVNIVDSDLNSSVESDSFEEN